MNQFRFWQVAVGLMITVSLPSARLQAASPVVKSEFIFQTAPTAFSNAPTVVETGGALVVAWYAGSADGQTDTKILLSRLVNNAWTTPVEVANGQGAGNTRNPCWNPVLFQPATGPLLLFYKVGPAQTSWWGMVKQSTDGGKTWGPARQLANGILGPTKNKPLQLNAAMFLCGSSVQRANVAPNDPQPAWLIHFEQMTNQAIVTGTSVPQTPSGISAIEPCILSLGGNKLVAFGRTNGLNFLFQVYSNDQGRTWGPVTMMSLPIPSSPCDGSTLNNGQQLLVYNHYKSSPTDRSQLVVATSTDALNWGGVALLENQAGGDFSYPAVIQRSNKQVEVVYAYNHVNIKRAVLDPTLFVPAPIVGGVLPTLP